MNFNDTFPIIRTLNDLADTTGISSDVLSRHDLGDVLAPYMAYVYDPVDGLVPWVVIDTRNEISAIASAILSSEKYPAYAVDRDGNSMATVSDIRDGNYSLTVDENPVLVVTGVAGGPYECDYCGTTYDSWELVANTVTKRMSIKYSGSCSIVGQITGEKLDLTDVLSWLNAELLPDRVIAPEDIAHGYPAETAGELSRDRGLWDMVEYVGHPVDSFGERSLAEALSGS